MRNRRDFLLSTASAAVGLVPHFASANSAVAAAQWNAGDVIHLMPTANHQRLLIKASFKRPQLTPPNLGIAGRLIQGRMGDTLGFHWSFDAQGLSPARTYTLQIVDTRRRRSLATGDVSGTGRQPAESPTAYVHMRWRP
jgi:hypothetical protein